MSGPKKKLNTFILKYLLHSNQQYNEMNSARKTPYHPAEDDAGYNRKLVVILVWAEFVNLRNKFGKPYKFDTATMEGIKEYYDDNACMTIHQIEAIRNIYSKFKVDEWFCKNVWNTNIKNRYNQLMKL